MLPGFASLAEYKRTRAVSRMRSAPKVTTPGASPSKPLGTSEVDSSGMLSMHGNKEDDVKRQERGLQLTGAVCPARFRRSQQTWARTRKLCSSGQSRVALQQVTPRARVAGAVVSARRIIKVVVYA